MTKIIDVEIFSIPLILREPYTIAYHTVTSVTNVGIILRMNDGLTGVGASGPEEEVTHETFETVLDAGKSIIRPTLLGFEFDSIHTVIQAIGKQLNNQPAALALVDIALHDYHAKSTHQSVASFLGASRTSLPTCITVNIHSPTETLLRVRKWMEMGFRMLKIKGGLSFDDDIEKLKLLRSEISEPLPIIFDVNQGYDTHTTLKFAEAASGLSITCIEQPIHKADIQGLSELAHNSPIPIMADESLTDLDTAKRLGDAGIRFFNLKLMKSGGIFKTKAYAKIASDRGVSLIVSCMDECALVNAAGLHYALSEPSITFVDLDSFTDYAVDPTRDAVHFSDGILTISEKPGLGYEFQESH